MDFTREPVIETVITPKEGCKLAVRNSKGAGQEEYFVDAVEIVSYGNAYFFRSLERPKSFFVPVTDYEILEVRETRMVLKNVGIDRTIKIGSSKEPSPQHRQQKELPAPQEKTPQQEPSPAEAGGAALEPRSDRKRERRRQLRRRRGKDDNRDASQPIEAPQEDFDVEETSSSAQEVEENLPHVREEKKPFPSTPHLILEPPKTLISETISRYRENGLYQEAFFERAAKEEVAEHQENGCEQANMPCEESSSCSPNADEENESFNTHKEDAGKVAGFPYGWESPKLDEQSMDAPLEDPQSVEEAEEEETKLTHRKENPYFHMTQDSIEP